jgi:alpha-1,6-mannosyltransferase
VLHICDINNFYSQTGGGVRTYHNQKRAWFQGREGVQYTLFQPDARARVEEEGNVRVVHFPAVPVGPDYRYIVDAGRLRRTLRDLAPDIIEVGSPYVLPPMALWAARGSGAKVIGFWHADYPKAYVRRYLGELAAPLGPLGEEAAWWYARQTYGRFVATFASADCVVDELERRGIGRIFQTPLGVDTGRFSPARRDEALRARVGAGPERPVLFFPHRLLEEKGLSNVCDAFPAIHAAHRPVMVFAGVGPGKARLDALLERQADVHYIGYIKDPEEMARWYASADVVFALSAFETFGLSAAEALASGCALVAANEGAVEELVRRSGGGVLVPYNDTGALIEATNALLASGAWRGMGAAAAAFARRHFSWDAAFTRMLGFYQEIAAAAGPEALSGLPRRWRPSGEGLDEG